MWFVAPGGVHVGYAAGDLDGFGSGGRLIRHLPTVCVAQHSSQVRRIGAGRPPPPGGSACGALCLFVGTNCLAPSWLRCGKVESSAASTPSAPPLPPGPQPLKRRGFSCTTASDWAPMPSWICCMDPQALGVGYIGFERLAVGLARDD